MFNMMRPMCQATPRMMSSMSQPWTRKVTHAITPPRSDVHFSPRRFLSRTCIPRESSSGGVLGIALGSIGLVTGVIFLNELNKQHAELQSFRREQAKTIEENRTYEKLEYKLNSLQKQLEEIEKQPNDLEKHKVIVANMKQKIASIKNHQQNIKDAAQRRNEPSSF